MTSIRPGPRTARGSHSPAGTSFRARATLPGSSPSPQAVAAKRGSDASRASWIPPGAPRAFGSLHRVKLDGIHHITAITADAPGNVDFYARVLGLRLVKKSVNQDDPTVYHLFYGDERGDPGADITFFEYPGARRGTAGAGMVHRIAWRVGSEDALGFWEERLAAEGVATEREAVSLAFSDPEGLGHELLVVETADEPLIADHPEVPRELALQG